MHLEFITFDFLGGSKKYLDASRSKISCVCTAKIGYTINLNEFKHSFYLVKYIYI